MKIILMHQTITTHDAIGNDIEAMYRIFQKCGDCVVYAENQMNPNLPYITREETCSFVQDPETIVIYHHSVCWEVGETILEECKCKIVIRYHNITPSEFFAPYNSDYFHMCSRGRVQTERLARKYPQAYWLLDSFYNGEDVPGVPDSRKAVCAPFHKIESWASAKPQEDVLRGLLTDDCLNLLFVSRVAPNKGHLFLLDVVYLYKKHFGQNVKLHIIGKFDAGVQKYNDLVLSKIRNLNLQDNVCFVGEVNDSVLVTYYLGCDFFLCASDHEGFGVPLIEAQYFKLPVIAKDCCATPETLGPDQVVLGDHPSEFAVALDVLNRNPAYYAALQEMGRANYDNRFTNRILEGKLIQAMKQFELL